MNHQKKNQLEICLCRRCAVEFLYGKNCHLRLADPQQKYLDLCDVCRTRRGRDYIFYHTEKTEKSRRQGTASGKEITF